MKNFYKLPLLIIVLSLGGCVGTETQKNLAEFFEENKSISARYRPGGSCERAMSDLYKNDNCEELLSKHQKLWVLSDKDQDYDKHSQTIVEMRVIRHFAEQKNCPAIAEWDDKKYKEMERDMRIKYQKNEKDILEHQEFQRKENARIRAADREKRERLLREIRSEEKQNAKRQSLEKPY